MCQAEKWWCIGCRNVRLGLQKCERFDPVTDFCESTNLENPPLKPAFENCDNLECKYLDPAFAWHPDRPLSPDSQAFAAWLKDVNDKMDSPSATTLDTTGAEPKAGSLQLEELVDKASGSGNIQIQGLKPTFSNSCANANALSVRLPQLLKTSSSVPQSRTNIPSEYTVTTSARQTKNGSLDNSKGSSNEHLGIQLQQTNAQTSRVINAYVSVLTKHRNRLTNPRGQSITTPTPSGGLQHAMNPGHRAVMDKLMNPNAGTSSRSSHSPSIPHWQMHFHNAQGQRYNSTPPQLRQASAARRTQSGPSVMSEISPKRAAYMTDLENQVRHLHAQHYRPTYHSRPVVAATMSNEVMVGHHSISTQDMNSPPSVIANNGHFQGVFLNLGSINQQQTIGSLNGIGTYPGFVQQAPAVLSDPRFNCWAQAGSHLPSFGQGHPHYQTAVPSFSPQGLPRPSLSLNGPKKSSHFLAPNDRLFWEHHSYSSLQSPISQQSNYSPVTYQAGLGDQIMETEHPAKRIRTQREGSLGTTQSNSNGSATMDEKYWVRRPVSEF
ncbi:hypothetical protein CI238_08684 [Colletotrichum incanum]|uniref:Uncharacterized protein n=1 Tax=Colletotrichum incanum TaxID=1573173 RepID=A0A161WAR7_COLIC|nr:hypothetical protein CI238_08684 [Colletotrichum incanum]